MSDHRDNADHRGPDRRDFLQTAGLVGAGLALSESLLRAEPPPQLTLSNTGPDQIPRKPFGRTAEKVFLMTKVCTHGRDKKVAMQQLDESLKRLRTDHLDLWQVHECVYDNDPERHFARGGVIEALDEAKKAGKVRYVGFTGHKHPDIHLKMLSYGYPFDSVQMPLNSFDATYRSFQKRVLPEVAKRGMAALGMKSLGGNGQPVMKGVVTAEEALRYAMS